MSILNAPTLMAAKETVIDFEVIRKKPQTQQPSSSGSCIYIYIYIFFKILFSLFSAFIGKEKKMAGFEQQVKARAKDLKVLFKKGVKIVGDSCKKGWHKVKQMRK